MLIDKGKDKLKVTEEMVYRQRPSQVMVIVDAASYHRMLKHARQLGSLWACPKTGARIRAKAVRMYIWDRKTNVMEHYLPVFTMFCSACDKPPDVHKGQAIYSDMLKTVAM